MEHYYHNPEVQPSLSHINPLLPVLDEGWCWGPGGGRELGIQAMCGSEEGRVRDCGQDRETKARLRGVVRGGSCDKH